MNSIWMTKKEKQHKMNLLAVTTKTKMTMMMVVVKKIVVDVK